MTKNKGKSAKKFPLWLVPVILFIVIGVVLVFTFAIPFISSPKTTGSAVKIDSSFSATETDSASSTEATTRSCHDVQVPYEEQEAYQKTEYYTETEPYQDTEYYNDYLQAEKVNGEKETRTNWSDFDVYAYAKVDLKNIDNEAGWFTVTFRWTTLDDGSTDHQVRHYIAQDQIVNFEDTYDIDSGEDYQTSSSFISDPVQKSRVVTKYRDVQRERQVTAYRPVTKYKTEQKCD